MRNAFVVLAAAIALAGCSSELPEVGTPEAALYVQRCGTCHPPYQPGLMTPLMWQAMVARMEIEMDRRGLELPAADKDRILAYLGRNGSKP
jgi:hypothetical protein